MSEAPTPRRRGRPKLVTTQVQPPKEHKKRGRKPGSLNKKISLEAPRRHSPRAPRIAAPHLMSLPFARPEEDAWSAPAPPPARAPAPFVEPLLAPPEPGYSGFPLEALPPRKKAAPAGRGRKPKNTLPTPEVSAEQAAALAQAEQTYAEQLQTPQLERLTAESQVRVAATPRKRGRPPNKSRVPSTPGQTVPLDNTTPDTRMRAAAAKRLKHTLPKKNSLLFSAPAPADAAPDDTTNNDDYCATCGGSGEFICCDACPKSFHLLCCDPPLRQVPEDNWNCTECRAAQGLAPRTLYNHLGMFGPLINALHGRNPREICLPKRLRDATFVDVVLTASGQYTDLLAKPEVAYSKLNGGQIAGFNRNDDLDIDALYDKDGRPFLCHRCRLSGRHHRTLVSCDYCPLKWHLDCLLEPVCLAKTLGLKWRCPNHVESLYPLNWQETRLFRDTQVVDSALHSHFLKIAMGSNFLIKHDDQPFIADARSPLLAEYLQYQKHDFVSNNTHFVERFQNKFGDDTDCDNDEDTAPQLRVPDFLQNYSVGGSVVAKSSRRLGKLLLMTNADDPDKHPFIYRVPERQVLLDFLGTRISKLLIVSNIQNYEQKANSEREEDRRVATDLAALSSLPAPLKLDELVAAAGVVQKQKALPEAPISPEEIAQLRQVKQLMEVKGHEALLNFLQH